MITPLPKRTPETAPDHVPNGWDTYNSHAVINGAIRSHLAQRDEIMSSRLRQVSGGESYGRKEDPRDG